MSDARWERCPECAEQVRLDAATLERLRDRQRRFTLVCSSCAERLRLDERGRLTTRR